MDFSDYPHGMYTVSKFLALASWLLLMLSLFMPKTRPKIWPLTQWIVPAILCVCYLMMVWDGRGALHLPGSFIVLDEIQKLYQNDSALTASWLHFLSFDLFAGSWMVRDGTERGMPVLLIFICLPFTFIFGPAGLLLYILLRFMVRRRGAEDAA